MTIVTTADIITAIGMIEAIYVMIGMTGEEEIISGTNQGRDFVAQQSFANEIEIMWEATCEHTTRSRSSADLQLPTMRQRDHQRLTGYSSTRLRRTPANSIDIPLKQ